MLALILISSLFGCKTKTYDEKDTASLIIEENAGSTESEQTQSTDITEKEAVQSTEQEQPKQTQNEQSESAKDTTDTIKQTESNSKKTDIEMEQTTTDSNDEDTQKQTEDLKEDEEIIQGDTHYQSDFVTDPFAILEEMASEIFIGTILETKIVEKPIEVPGYVGFEKGAMVYKIQIEKVYRGTCITNNTAVYLYNSLLIDDHTYSFKESDYAKVGEKYIFNSIIKPVNDEPILVGLKFFSPKIEEDGKLTATNQTTKNGLEKISTLEAFDNSEELNKIWKTDFKNLYDNFTRYIKTEKTEQELIADLKKAILADSEFKMNLTPNQSAS